MKIENFFDTISIGDNMNIIEINKQTLYNLYEQFPESFNGLSLEGNNLVYQGESVDISNFNINDLLTQETAFSSSLSVLSAEDVFKIIRLHATKLNSETKEDNKSEVEQKVEIIKQENPLMQNISIVTRSKNGIKEEFLNIVDSYGRDNLFRNDRSVDLFAIYETLKYENIGHDVTPDELVDAINRKLYQVHLTEARDLEERTSTTEEFSNKMNTVNAPYKDDKIFNVYGNEENDIAVIADQTTNNHRVVTFDHNEFGDLVVESHNQNVAGSDTSVVKEDKNEDVSFESEVESSTSLEVKNDENNEVVARLITPEKFYELINSGEDLTAEQQNDVNLYYAYIGDLIIYEDYLLAELRQMLNGFRAFIYDLEYGEQEFSLNSKQEEAIRKNQELEEKKSQNISPETMEQINKEVRKLELVKSASATNSAGSVSTIQVIAFIVGVSIILTAITLYLIG